MLGVFKSRFSIYNWVICGLETLFLGALVAGLGFFIAEYAKILAPDI